MNIKTNTKFELSVAAHTLDDDVSKEDQVISDLVEYMRILEIDNMLYIIKNIYVRPEFRGKGIASDAVLDFCRRYNDKIIVVSTEITKNSLTDKFTDTTLSIDKMSEWMIRLGFININNVAGVYPNKCVFVYPNRQGISLVNKIHELVDTII